MTNYQSNVKLPEPLRWRSLPEGLMLRLRWRSLPEGLMLRFTRCGHTCVFSYLST